MTERKHRVFFLEKVKDFISHLSLEDRAKIAGQIEMMSSGTFNSVYVKTLRKPIKELIANKYRFLFFIKEPNIYFILAFTKKTQKTPKQYIQKAQQLYKTIIKRI